jgi:putative peptide zinc metalloprotease protein
MIPEELSIRILNLPIESFLMSYAYLIFTGFMHEFGHATALIKYGERPGRIGVGVYFIMPVFFSDVTRAWKLNRKQRFMVDLGGIYFQGVVLVFSFLINELFFKSEVLFLGIMLSTMTILTNFNPFLKMDGYWMFSDLIGIENPHKMLLDILKFPFKKKSGAINPINVLGNVKKVIVMIYLLTTSIFFAYFIIIIFHSLSWAFNLIYSDISILFADDSFITDTSFGNILSYLSSRFPSIIMLFFTARMAFNIVKSLITFVVKRKAKVDLIENN